MESVDKQRGATLRRWCPTSLVLLAAVVFTAGLTGCAGYRAGALSLYPGGIQTVHVPIFESKSFRRGMGERLTEAVQKQIEKETPYRVVGSPEQADTILRGQIVNDTKRVTAGSKSGYPRAVELNVVVQTQWIDRRTGRGIGRLGPQGQLPACNMLLEPFVSADSTVVPQVGQSIATGYQETMVELAEQIVNNMQMPW